MLTSLIGKQSHYSPCIGPRPSLMFMVINGSYTESPLSSLSLSPTQSPTQSPTPDLYVELTDKPCSVPVEKLTEDYCIQTNKQNTELSPYELSFIQFIHNFCSEQCS